MRSFALQVGVAQAPQDDADSGVRRDRPSHRREIEIEPEIHPFATID